MATKLYRRRQKGETIEQQLDRQAVRIAELRKADAAVAAAKEKKKKDNWVSKLKENIRLLLKGPKHSPAGKKYLEKKRTHRIKS